MGEVVLVCSSFVGKVSDVASSGRGYLEAKVAVSWCEGEQLVAWCVCVCVCVCVCERERVRESVCVCVRERVCVCMCE